MSTLDRFAKHPWVQRIGILLLPFLAAIIVGNLTDNDWLAYGLYVLGVVMVLVFAIVRFVKWAAR